MSLKDIGVAPPKGFRDLLPQETALRDYVQATILAVYRAHGFERIETPIVEDVRRLKHSEGGENLSLIFQILKRGERLDLSKVGLTADDLTDLALRYDLTVPLARYYAANHAQLLPTFKAIQIGPVFRAERPQRGRYRQFVQCDIDVIGGKAPFVEIELIEATLDVLSKFNLTRPTVRVNDRRILTAMVQYAGIDATATGPALVILDKLDKIGIDGVRDTFIKEGFSEIAATKVIDLAQSVLALPESERLSAIQTALSTHLPESVFVEQRTIVEAVMRTGSNGGSVTFDPFLVRGMGYYTGAVFEVVVPDFSGSIAGGGRYDNLIEKLSGMTAPACGFSIGFERLILLLESQTAIHSGQQQKIALFYNPERDSLPEVLAHARQLRAGGVAVSIIQSSKNMRATLEKLKRGGFDSFGTFLPGSAPTLKAIE